MILSHLIYNLGILYSPTPTRQTSPHMTSSSSHTVTGISGTSVAHRENIDTPVSVEVISPQSLCGPVLDQWNSARNSNPVFQSPCFDVEYTKAVARVRDDVKIVVCIEDNEIVSFLPFQENRAGHAVPVGGMLNDWHGIMGKKSATIAKEMLKAAGLKSYKFHASPCTDDSLKPYYFNEVESHHLDLSDGWEAYQKWVFKNSSTIKRQGQKTRRLEREVGKVRFDFDCPDPNLLEQLIELKRSRYQRSNTFDILGVPWAADMIREIHKIREPNFRGLLSTFWAGDQLIGAHFGLLTNQVLHYWFPVYDRQFHKYSPGTELLMQSAKHACELGIPKLDLGYGDDAYKFKFCNSHEPIAIGMVNFNRASHAIAKRRYFLRNDLKQIPMKPLVKRVLRKAFPRFGGWNFR